ncbi:MAG TPA: ROK family transcriptional regulator [Phototrophicaceae bacterium]|nr:ROK family transcriptional regulator [Phototrophicaceae bacterium]
MRRSTSVDHTAMREMNLALIMDTLRLCAPISRAALAEQTGLNKASVSNMVKELMASGYIREIGTADAPVEVGRPAINLQLNPEAGYLLSAEIGVGFISIIVANFAFDIVARRYEDTGDEAKPEVILGQFIELLDEVYRQINRRGRPIFGLAVGLPGLVDMATGRLLFAPNLVWRDVPLRDRLQPHFNGPIVIANEANMAALGESYFGPGQKSRLLLYVSSGVGLGGGMVIGSRLLTGMSGLAGEFGHMTVDPQGPLCHCGNHGCWETQATQPALFRRVRAAIGAGRGSMLARYKGQLSVPLVVDAAQNGDAVALEACEQTACWLGLGLANLVNTLNPEHVVFGGALSLAHPIMMPLMRQEIERRAFRWIWEQVNFSTATYTADAAVMGGVAMIHRHVINHPMTWQQPENVNWVGV